MNALSPFLRSLRRPHPSRDGSLCIGLPKVKGKRLTSPPVSSVSRSVPPEVQPRSRRDPLGRLLAHLIQRAGCHAVITDSSSRPWASATFVGAQHRIFVHFTGAATDRADIAAHADAFALALPDAEFSIPGHVVADLVIDERSESQQGNALSITFTLTVLTIEDW